MVHNTTHDTTHKKGVACHELRNMTHKVMFEITCKLQYNRPLVQVCKLLPAVSAKNAQCQVKVDIQTYNVKFGRVKVKLSYRGLLGYWNMQLKSKLSSKY